VAGVIFILIGLGINVKDKGFGKVSDVRIIQQPATAPLQSEPVPQLQVQPVDNTITTRIAPETPATLTEQVKASLISAIRYADDVEITSGQTLNAQILENAFTGEALRTIKMSIENLRVNNQVQYSTLNSQKFLNFKISEDKLRAEVKLVENWTTYYYSVLTKECLGGFPAHDAPQTIYLVKAADGWIVETIVHDPTAQLTIQPCD
jgi:hypothetical protein